MLRVMSTDPRDLEAQADELLRRAAAATTKKPEAWTTFSSPEREAAVLAGGVTDEDLARYARELREQHDPRGELALFQGRGDQAAADAFIKARSKLLFAGPTGHARLRHITFERWSSGFLVEAGVRFDKVHSEDLRNFMWSPSTRFLKRLTLTYVDDQDDFALKLRHGKEQLVHACNVVRASPCRGALEVVLVRSLDPSGQPAAALAEHPSVSTDMTRPLKRLREFRLVFDSE